MHASILMVVIHNIGMQCLFENKQWQLRLVESKSNETVPLAQLNFNELKENLRVIDVQTQNNFMTHLQAQFVIESKNEVQFKENCDQATQEWTHAFGTAQ